MSRKYGKEFNVGLKMNINTRKKKQSHILLKWKYFANMLLKGAKQTKLSIIGRWRRLANGLLKREKTQSLNS